MAERNLNTALKKRLINNEPFVYAHLIKYERPHGANKNGKHSTDAKRYAYLTDGAVNIDFNDGSLATDGTTANGTQTYIADKIAKIGSYSETIEAKATGMTLTISAESLNNSITSSAFNFTTTTITAPTGIDLVAEGFREGDKIQVSFTSLATTTGTQVITGTTLPVSAGTKFAVGDIITAIGTDTTRYKVSAITSNTLTIAQETDSSLGLAAAVSNGVNISKELDVRVTGIKTNNTVLNISNIDSTLIALDDSTSVTLKIVSDELKGPLTEMNDSTVKSYHNRDVFIYKAFLDPETYAIIGAPVLVFKGIIASASLQDNPSKNLTVNWKLTSHWGDFAQVNGRPTSDAIHRAIDENGVGQPDIALKDVYANDFGFAHADVTLSTMSTYKYMEKVPKLVSKRTGLFKLRRKYSQEWVDEEREAQVDLNWALSAKYLPVVYGVDLVEGIPIFVDTENGNSTQVYVAYAICEGEIGGIYDFYFDDHPRVCLNVEDYDARRDGGTEENAEVTCIGRADKGTVLGGKALVDINSTSATAQEILDMWSSAGSGGGSAVGGRGVGALKRELYYYNTQNAYKSQTGMDATADTGILHEQTHEVDTPNEMFLTVHAGLTHQRANDTLVSVASANNVDDAGNTIRFKRQTDYYNGPDYWGADHKLSDTAYVLVKCTIGEDDESVPETKYVVRGKLIDCYNYDFSYRRDSITYSPADDPDNFKIGDTVGLRNTTGNAYLKKSDNSDQDDLVIIDKWQIVTNEGQVETRFRFSDAPGLNYSNGIPTITSFYMEDDTSGTTLKYHFVSSNHVENSGTVPSALTSAGTISISSNKPIITFTSAPNWVWDSGAELFPKVNTVDDDLVPIAFNEGYTYDGNSYMAKHSSNGTVLTILGAGTDNYLPEGETSVDDVDIIRTDAIQLATSASSTNDVYNGMRIELTTVDSDGDYTVQKREIIDYDGSLKIAQINIPWDKDKFPKQESNFTYTYKILAPKDQRVSTNPAIQLLDYSTSETYGKRLDLDTDIEVGSWLSAARTCDSRGTQTCHGTRIIANANDRYVLTSTGAHDGDIIAMGKVKTTVNDPGAGVANSVEFEEVYGKFTKTFMADRHNYVVGDIIANYGGYYRVGTAGTQPAKTATVASTSTGTGVTIETGGSISVGQVVFGLGIREHVTVSAVSGTSVTLSSSQKLTAGTKLYFCSNLTRLTSFNLHKLGAANSNSPLILTRTTEGAYDDTTEYSIYNSDFIKYWRQLGWEGHHQRWVTRHQMCTTLDTSNSVFNNINGMLQQFNGILSFEAGKYALRIEVESDDTEQTSDIATSSDTGYTIGTELNHRYITDDNIIGTIKVSDPGPKKSYNTVSSTISDPGSKFEGKQVSFYNSEFLRTDKNVIKSGNFSQPSIHNYYNARINVENYLKQSRYQTKVNFTLGPRGLLLVTGDVISLTHSKFGWNQKQFRIENLNFKTNCTVDVSASEYDDSFYTITTPTLESNQIPSSRTPVPYSLSAPTKFTVSAGAAGQIDLVWKNAANLPSNSVTEIWYAAGDTTDTSIRKYLGSVTAAPKVVNQVNDTNVTNSTTVTMDSVTGLVAGMVIRGTTALDTASLGNSPVTISSISGNDLTISASQTIPDNTRLTFLSPGEYTHYIGLDGSDKTYWLRHSYTDIKSGKTYTSDFATRQAITTVYPGTLYQVTVNSDAQIFSANSSSVIQNPDYIKFTAAKTNLSGAFVWSTDHSVNLYAATSGGSPTTSGTSVYLRKADMGSNDDVVVTATVTSTSAERTAGAEDTYTESITIPRIDAGGGAGTAKTVRIRSSSLIFLDDNDGGTNPDSPDWIKLEAVKQNTSAAASWATSPSVNLYAATSGGSPTTSGDTVYMRKADYAANTSVLVTLTCDSITDTTSIIRLKRNSGTVQAVLSNPAHVLPADSDGAVSNTQAAGSGTQIRVYEGATALSYVPSGTGAGEWDVAITDTSGITEGGKTDSGTYATIDAHTGVTTGTDTYTITYTISGKKLDGTAFTNFTTNQYLTKAKAGIEGATAKIVSLTANDYSIVYDSAGNNPTPNTSTDITLTAATQGFTAPTFKFTGDGFTDETSYASGSGSSDTFTFPVPAAIGSLTNPSAVKVSVQEGSSGGEVASDTISIYGVQPGATGGAGAENVELKIQYLGNAGTYDAPESGSSFTGGSYNFSNNTFTPPTGWVLAIPTFENYRPIWQSLGTASAAVNGTDSSITWTAPTLLSPGRQFLDLFYKREATKPTPPTTSVNSTPSGWSTTVPSGSDTLWQVLASGTLTSGQHYRYSFGEVTRVDTASYTVICTNESHTYPANNSGTVSSSTGSGTSFEVFRGGTQLTGITSGTPTVDQFKVTATATNITASSTNGGSVVSNAVVFADHTAGTIFSGTSNLTASISYSIAISTGVQAETVTKKQTFTKTLQGDVGDDGDNVATVTLYQRTSSGSSAPAVINDTSTYTFATGVLTNSNGLDSWTQTVPSGAAQYLWTTTATAVGANGATTASVVTGAWATPTVQSEAQQPRTFTKAVFYDNWTSGTVSAPTSTGFDWDDMELDGLSSGWSNSNATVPFAYCVYDATENTYGGTTTITFQPVGYLTSIAYEAPNNLLNNQLTLTISGTTLGLTGSDGTDLTLAKGNVGLSDLDSLESGSGTKLGGIATGATVGAVFGTNLYKTGTTNFTAAELKNDSQVWGDVGGSGKPADNATVGAVFGTNLYKTGTTNFTAAELKNDSQVWGDVGGTGKPADNATVGAKLGTNFLDASNNSLGNEDVRNSDLSLAYSGTNIQIKKGSTQIGSNVDAPTALKNAQVTMSANGTLNYDGTTAQTPSLASIGGTVAVAQGGTGETNTNKFLNSGISVAQSGSTFTLTRGDGGTNETTISKSVLGLDYTDGATDNGTTINTSGNITGNITVNSKMTISYSNEYILVED